MPQSAIRLSRRSRAHVALDIASTAVGICHNIAFPTSNNEPPQCTQFVIDSSVARDIAGYFRNPVWRVVTCRQSRDASMEVAAVPKVAVDEYNNALASEHHVRAAGQTCHGNPVP